MQNETYIYVTISSKEENSENIVAISSIFPILGIEENGDKFVLYFREKDWQTIDYDFFCSAIRTFDPEASIVSVEKIDEKNWNEEWEKNVTPVIVNDRIAIVPSWKVGSTKRELELIIDPKMSFGTGHHSTTRIMIKLAEKYVKPESFWIDVGTGTGILAILAKKLGAREVLALDNNSWSIQNAYENLKNNKITEGVDLIEMDIDTLPNLPIADGIFANLNLDLVLRNLGKFYSSVQENSGVVLVSGILVYDYDEFESVAKQKGFDILEVLKEEEWFGAVLSCG